MANLPYTRSSQRTPYQLTFAMLALAGFASGLLALVTPALPLLQRDLHTSTSAIAWLLTGYLLSGSVATPLIGRLGDIYGKKRILVVVLALLVLGTLLSALATSLPLMLVGRVVAGFSVATFPLAFGIIRDEFPAARVAGGLGLMSAILGISTGVAVVLAGVIVDNLDYHWLFWLPLILGVLAVAASWLVIPASPVRAAGRIPWLGAVLLSAGLVALLLAITQAPTWGWGSWQTLVLLLAGLAVLVVWVLVELRERQPLVDMHVMARRGVWTTNLVGFLSGIGMYAFLVLIAQLVTLPLATGFGFGTSNTGAGLFLLPMPAMMVIAGVLSGRLERLFGSKLVLVVAMLFVLGSYLLLALAHSQPAELYIASGLLGIGIGLAFAAMANLIVMGVPPEETGVATGINTIVRTVGGALGSQVVATILATSLIAGTRLPAEQGFVLSFWIVAAASAVAVLAALTVPGRSSAKEASPVSSATATTAR